MGCTVLKTITYVIDKEQSGKRIKDILRQKGISASVLKKLKSYKEGIVLNDTPVYSIEKVCEGDSLVINLFDNISGNVVPVDIPLNIIYEDDDILVVNKPRSMPTHPSQNHHSDSLANAVMWHFKDTPFTFRVITRLDKDTSGVVIVAKNKISAGILTKQLTDGSIKKEYIALCHGCPHKNKGIINAPIGRCDNSLIKRHVCQNGKEAVTHYEVIENRGELSLIKLFPQTGRTHQLRVHLSHIGVPIYGDDMYGSPVKDERTRLHCRMVKLRHPENNKIICFEAPIPKDMTQQI